ncbi:MAG: cation:proton antiporter [Candidatus Nanohaloarchaea archaeon]
MTEIITVLTAVFLVSSLLIFVLDRFSHPALPAYIVSGILLGSYLPKDQFLNLSQLGIAFLVFVFGLKADIGRIRSVAEESISATLIQVVLAGTTMYIIGKGLGFNSLNSLYLAAAGALSSSLVGLELIESEVRIELLHGRLAEAIQLMQDFIAIAFIAVISSGFTYQGLGRSLLALFLLIGAGVAFRQAVFSRISLITDGSEELLMIISLALLTGFVAASQLLDVSIVVGSFAAGLAVARFPENMEILDSMGSLKDFFSAIFFVSLGALIATPSETALLLTLVLLTGTLIIKPVITSIALLIAGYDRRSSYLAGMSLDQISEFALIIAIQGYISGAVHVDVFHAIVLAATASMIVSSYTSRYEEEIYALVSGAGFVEVNGRKINERTRIPDNLNDHVIVVGYDTQGKELSEALEEENQDFVIIENDPEKIEEALGKEEHYVFGDVMDQRTWDTARVKEAELIISTIPSWTVSREILGLETEADIILRSSEIREASRLLDQGAFYVNVPDILSSEELVDHVNGVLDSINYREELRRRNLLEVRRYLQNR